MNKLTLKQESILLTLFKYRGLLFDQIATIVADLLQTNNAKTFKQNLYKTMQKLEKEKYLIRDIVTIDQRPKYFIYLSNFGLEYVYDLLDIPPGKKGTGYDNDFGEFPYELYRPFAKVNSQNIKHHLLLTDVLFKAMAIEGVKIRDNRYSSVEYEWENQKYRFRPDGEMLIDGKRYFLEIDRHTESLEGLKEKFERYDRYLKWCKRAGEELPHGVIVIIEKSSKTGYTRRWNRFFNAYFSKMKDWYLHVNLIYGTVYELETIIEKEREYDEDFKTFRYIVKHYMDEQSGIKGLFTVNVESPIYCHNGMRHSTTESSKAAIYRFGYERFTLYETKPLVRLYELYKFIMNKSETKNTFIPVFYNTTGKHFPLNFSGCEDENMLNHVFSNPIWLKTTDEKRNPFPIWTNKTGERITIPNPLLIHINNRS